MNKFPATFLLTVFLQFLLANAVSAQPPKEKKGKKKTKEIVEEVVLDTIEIAPTNPITDYKAVPTKHFNLIHTKLQLNPSFNEKKLYGIADLTITPHFYAQDKVVMDAKGMNIDYVRLNNVDLTFTYDNKHLSVVLPKSFSRKDTLTLQIKYVAKPYELDSATIKMGRGMYFINSNKSNPYKPTHLWTQGETVAASCWFPTFDVTYQKTTQEVYVTIDSTLTSFSNGLLLFGKNNGDGTRTDYWKQSLPHAPYLFVLVVGPYQKYQDKWRDIAVNYYTFPKYLSDVQKVFGRTPDMMEYFSNLLGVDYPWEKYDQTIMYDYTAGAMENTSASVFYESMLCSHRDLLDREYGHDLIIAHELFHQWFGDLVTCENWSQLTLNESFANYSEQLWLEEWRGADDAELHWLEEYNSYMNEFRNGKSESIVNYFFKSPDAMFDRHRYDKGGRVLHMLRKHVGDEAFFTSLKHFLSTKSFQSAEIHDLRLSFEAVTGEDLNWFFNQWWLSPGHPMVDLKHRYDAEKKVVVVDVIQTQGSYELSEIPTHKIPLEIDLIFEKETIRKNVWVTDVKAHFEFEVTEAPLAVNVDPGKMQLWERTDQLSTAELLTIFNRSEKILDKVFALEQLKGRQSEPEVKAFMLQAMNHKNWFIRKNTIAAMKSAEFKEFTVLQDRLKELALKDEKPVIRREALVKLNGESKSAARQTAIQLLDNDSSFSVLAKALEFTKDSSLTLAYNYASGLDTFENQIITMSVAAVFADSASASDIDFFERALYLQWANSFYQLNESFLKYLAKTDESVFERGLVVLKNIIENEETGRHIRAAKRTIQKLNDLKVAETARSADSISQAKKDTLAKYTHLIN